MEMFTMISGQRIGCLPGRADVSSLTASELKPEYFPMIPTEVDKWESMSKKALKLAMKDGQYDKYKQAYKAALAQARQEREGPVPHAANASATSSRRTRPTQGNGIGTDAVDYSMAEHNPDGQLAVVIDCGYDALMSDKAGRSLSVQLAACYSSTRKLRARLYQDAFESMHGLSPGEGLTRDWRRMGSDGEGIGEPLPRRAVHAPPSMHPMFTGLSPARIAMLREAGGQAWRVMATREPLEHVFCCTDAGADSDANVHSGPTIAGQDGAGRADVAYCGIGRAPSGPERSLPRARLVYLSADADTELQELLPFPHAVYCIGGLVDRNLHKGAAASRAAALGIATARLPIAAHIRASRGSLVLTTNHVVGLLAAWWRCKDWALACAEVLPSRKFEPREEGAEGRESESGGES